VLLVATAGVTSRRHLSRGIALLNHAEAPIIGVVLNAVSTDARYGSDYGYSYYRQETGHEGRRKRPARGSSSKSVAP
jgi:Mrp family chromosome partitioning ATPase